MFKYTEHITNEELLGLIQDRYAFYKDYLTEDEADYINLVSDDLVLNGNTGDRKDNLEAELRYLALKYKLMDKAVYVKLREAIKECLSTLTT